MAVIGIDTSNYTTSIAFLDGEQGENCGRLLPVKQGELGLRQSDAVFAHIKGLPELSGAVFPYRGEDGNGRRCQYPSKSGRGQLYALLPGGLFPREASE